MRIAKNKAASFDYTLKGMDDEVIDSSGPAPLAYLHGYENIISGLEKALEGKAAGDSFEVIVPAVEAYGEWDGSIVTTVPISSFDGVEGLAEGMEFEARFPNGSQTVKIIKVAENEVTVDANHPLAGMDLRFEITVRDVRDATEGEIACGHVHQEYENCSTCFASDTCKAGGCCGGSCCRH